ncbi:MAG: helix-turn-helix domain-containing protein [Pseudomonadota bacterium]
MNTKKNAPASGANNQTTPPNFTDESAASQGFRILEHLKKFGKLDTLEARRDLGIMNPAQRVSELRKRGVPINTERTLEADENGAWHWVAVYLWRGNATPPQADLWEGC